MMQKMGFGMVKALTAFVLSWHLGMAQADVFQTKAAKIDLGTSGAALTVATFFSLTTTGQAAPEYGTIIQLHYDKKNNSLIVFFDLNNDLYVNQNQYVTPNSAIWSQEAFEMFISSEHDNAPRHYIEIEINPNNALFSALIDNPNGKGTKNKAIYLDAAANGITHDITKKTEHSWSGYIRFPFALLGEKKKSYRVNFFRIVSKEKHTLDAHHFWSCSRHSCVFLAWNPTMSGKGPDFHIPKFFVPINLRDKSH